MIEVRIHGRGGQGNVVAAYLLASAAVAAGRHGQAFPAFGAEQRGAPVVAFARIDTQPIELRCQVRAPAYLVVQDAGLLTLPGVTAGLLPGGGLVVDSEEDGAAMAARLGARVLSLPASRLAKEHLGRSIPNVALIAALLRATALLPESSLVEALAERFRGEVLERNKKLIAAIANHVAEGAWNEADLA